MAEEIVNVGYLRDPETHEIFLPQTDESLVTGLTNKIDTAINNKISSLDGIATIPDTGTGVNVITEVSETDGILSSKQKTITEGSKIDVTGASGSITIAHESITTTPTDNSVDPPDGLGDGERESYVITDVTTDGYGHITAYTKDKSTNLIAADIKAPVKRQDDTTWNYRETGGDITIGEDTARIPVLKGNTIVWNQIVPQDKIHITGTGAGGATPIEAVKYFSVIQNHYYMFMWSGTTATLRPRDVTADIAPNVFPTPTIWKSTATSNGTTYLQVYAESGVSVDIYANIIDLTKLFGSDEQIAAALGVTVANITSVTAVANFEKLFPNSYYPYCEGRLVNLGGYGVKMNQLVQNGDFDDGVDGWVAESGTTLSVLDKTLTVNTTVSRNGIVKYPALQIVSEHKYCFMFTYKAEHPFYARYGGEGFEDISYPQSNSWSQVAFISAAITKKSFAFFTNDSYAENSIQLRNVQLIDLTEMFGPGSEPTLEEFEAMFPNDYYEYNTGTEMNIFDAIGDKKLGLISTGDIPDESEPHAVDMGLPSGLLWADSNIDVTQEDGFAASPYQYECSFFSWGNVEGHNPISTSAFDYNWGGVNSQEPWYDGQPYGNTSGNSLTADIVTHNASQDAAYKNCGAPWHMPSSVEFKELTDNCDFIDASGNIITGTNKLTTVGGVVGIYLRSKINGNRLFFACSGDGDGSSWYLRGSYGYYWSASFNSARYARHLYFNSGGVYPQTSNSRCYGFAVRAVRYKKQTLDLDWIREIEYTPDGSSTSEKLFPYGLLSVGSVHDEVTEIKAIKRVGVVDLGDCEFGSLDGYTGLFACNPFTGYNFSSTMQSMCSKYITGVAQGTAQAALMTNMVLFFYHGSSTSRFFYLNDPNLSSSDIGSDNKIAKLQGIKLYYELETPIEIPLDEPHLMSYVVDDHGTEQQIPINVSSVINAPFRGTFEYMSNFKEGVLDLMGRFNDFTPTTKIIPDSTTTNSTLPTSQAVIDYMRAGGNGVKPVYESGDEVTPTTDVHAGLKTEVGNNSYKYYKVPFSAVTNDPSTGTSQVQIILNGNFS